MRAAFLAIAAVGVVSLAVPASAQDGFFDSAGVTIHYIEQGSGEPVVLLHGIGGSVRSWIDAGVVEGLAAHHRVIAFDARGHGQSGKPRDPAKYGREMALDVVRLLDHLSIPRAHIVGFSMGGGTTSQLLTMHPERFLTATLVAGAGRFEWTAENARQAEQEAVEREKECISRSLIYRLAPTDAPKPSEEDIRERSAACFADVTQDRFAIAAVTRSRGATLIRAADAAAVTVPTLGIVGSLDPAIRGLKELNKIRPAVRLVVLDGAVHSSADLRGVIRHAGFVPAVRSFIASSAVSPTARP
jgi:pimeloyl-ACP methyl ester carboxylesterase